MKESRDSPQNLSTGEYNPYVLGRWPSMAPHGGGGPLGWWAALAEAEEEETATRSHWGHMVRVVGGLIFIYS